jgi:hypothetical protein
MPAAETAAAEEELEVEGTAAGNPKAAGQTPDAGLRSGPKQLRFGGGGGGGPTSPPLDGSTEKW